MLNERVAKTVETALVRSAPGNGFVLGVMAALPMLSMSAKAATVGATAAKGSSVAKAAAATGLLGAVMGPFCGFLGMWLGYRGSVSGARSDNERAFAQKYGRILCCLVAGYIGLDYILQFYAQWLLSKSPMLYVVIVVAITGAFAVGLVALLRWARKAQTQLRMEQSGEGTIATPTRVAWEYRSRRCLLGLPLVPLRMGGVAQAPVKAWIASGGTAYGVLFAFGGLAVAPVSVGGLALGLFSFGGTSAGVLALGGLGLGVWAVGGAALGWQAFGGCAIAWNAAMGGVAVARDFALGGIAHAAQANNDAAVLSMRDQWFFRLSGDAAPYLALFNLLWIIPLMARWIIVARHRKAADIVETNQR